AGLGPAMRSRHAASLSTPPAVDPDPTGGREASSGLRAPAPVELSVVMPVFNEARILPDVVPGWASELDRLGVDSQLPAYDDGSTAESRRVLQRLRERLPRLTVHGHANRGHGHTVLGGYREARADWIFQTDSDGEIAPASFRALWDARHGHDLVLGIRQGGR